MSATTQSTTHQRPVTVYAAIAANLVIAIAKFIVAAVTGSSAMLSEGIHSIADTGNQLLLLIGIHRGRKPSDMMHPFGYGKELYFWSLIVAVILFGVGGGMSIYEGITHIEHPADIGNPTWNYVVLVLAFLAEGTSWIIALRHLLRTRTPNESLWQTLRRSKNPEIYVVIGEDSAALLGIVIAFLGVFLSHTLDAPVLDGAASIGVGIVLIIVASFLAFESRSLIVGESASRLTIEGIYDILKGDPRVERFRRPLTMHLGPHEVLLTLDIEFSSELSSEALAAEIDQVEKRISEAYPEIKHIYIEAQSMKRNVEKHK